MDIRKILDQIDEIIYIADLNTCELLYLNRIGRERFGTPAPGVKCYEFLQGEEKPCKFCTNGELSRLQDKRITWVRQHPTAGNLLLHDSVIDYAGRPCRMEIAIGIDSYITELNAAQNDLRAEKKLVTCIEDLVMNHDFSSATNSMLNTIIEHYNADRAYIFEFDWEKNVTRNTYEVCREGVTPEIDNLQNLPIAVVAVWVNTFLNGEKKITVIEDVDALKDDPERSIEYDCLHPQGIKSLITVPIFIDGKLHGFLGVDNPNANMDAPELLMRITYIAENEFSKQLLKQELIDKSYHDPLTGLNNRLAYDEMLADLLGKKVPTGVGFVDLNSLKWINDNYGYEFGNRAIELVCKILKTHFQEDCIYRISGDEFVIIWPDVDYLQFKNAAGKVAAALILEQNIAAFGYTWGHEEDVGIAVQRAEKAMQAEKAKYYAAIEKTKGVRPGFVELLLQEFRDSTFVPYLQPLYSIQNDKVYGAEVLVRKVDPNGHTHFPQDFVTIMEREGMISMVDLEMLRQACELLQQWKTAWPELTLNVNISRFTLSEPDYLTRVDKIIAETGADPTRLVFEVTESFVEIDLESLSDVLNGLIARGITVAIDDFGVNASNLNTIGLSQFSIAKLDKSLIDQAEHSKRMQYVVKAAIELCHGLKMLCVAEGIETDSQIELLKALGCDRLQGYLIGKPMPAAEFFHQFGEAALHKK